MAKPKLPKKLYVVSWSTSGFDGAMSPTLGLAKKEAQSGERIGVYELVKEVANPK